MPTLANTVSRILRNTRYMVSQDDVIASLNEEGFLLYSRVLKEGEGFFVKTDETSVVLVPGTQVYSLPVDCTQVAHMAERAQPTDPWLKMTTESQNMALEAQESIVSSYVIGILGASRYSYYGPYLPDSQVNTASPEADNSTQIQQITVSPLIDTQRNVQVVYTAKWIDILDESSTITLPAEAMSALYNKAMANLTNSTDDTRSGGYANLGELQAKGFLSWVRDRELQTGPKVTSYL
jgi:hypothetical protein